MLSTVQMPYRAPIMASVILVLAILQGTSVTLTLALRSPWASQTAVSLVTLLWLLMYVIAVVGLIVSSGVNWATWMVRYRLPLTLLVAGTAFSAAWSVDAGLTTERVVHLIGTTMIAVYLGFSLPLTRILRLSALVLGLLMLASAAAALGMPALGIEHYEGQSVWTGVMASKNTLGFWSAISVLLLISLSFWSIPTQQRIGYWCLALISAVCLAYSVSATSILALVAAAIVMVYLHTAFSLRLGFTAICILGAFVIALSALAFNFIDTAELIGRSGDLTGRGDVWKQTWKLILERPLTGFGYGTIWYPTQDSVWIQQSLTDFTWTVYHAHNGLLQIASEIGLPLTALAVFMILQQLIEIVYCQYQRQQPGVLFILGFLIVLLVSNYSEARLLVNRELYWIFFITLPISMLQQVTLMQSQTGVMGMSAALPNSKGIKAARELLAQRRTLKKRLRKQRRLKLINANEQTTDAIPTTTDLEHSVRPLDMGVEGIAANTDLIYKDNQIALERKMIRRNRKD